MTRNLILILVSVITLSFGATVFVKSIAAESALFAGIASAQENDNLFNLVGNKKSINAESGSENLLDDEKLSVAAFSQQEIAINFDRLKSKKIQIPLFDGKTYEALQLNLEQGESSVLNAYTWRGKIIIGDFSGDVILTTHKGAVSGLIYSPTAVYEIVPQENFTHFLVELNQSLFPECAGDIVPPEESKTGNQFSILERNGSKQSAQEDFNINKLFESNRSSEFDSPITDDGSLIDVMVVYSDDVRAALGGTAQAQVLAQNSIAITNTAYQNSGINTRVRLVHAREISYDESPGTLDAALTWITGNSTIAADRNTYKADMVAFIVQNASDGCGLAWTMNSVNPNFAPSAYSAVQRDCAVGNITFPHELGHNQGMHHNPENARPPSETAFPYNYGHFINGSFRTIMSYVNPCTNGCPKVPYFSNPSISYNGHPTGMANQRDNARVLNNTAATVAKFRDGGGKCTYNLNYNYMHVGAMNGSGSFDVITENGCSWNAQSSVNWITINSPQNQFVGSGTVNFTFLGNASISSRSGTISVGGKTFELIQGRSGFHINDVSIKEPASGTAIATFTVHLLPHSTQPSTVNVSTANNSAVAPDDYVAIPATILTFASGETSKQVQVTINSDNAAELVENFYVNLSNASHGLIYRNQAVGRIMPYYTDSGKIVFAGRFSSPNANKDIYTVNIDGSELTNLTNTPSVNEDNPSFSPQGSQIVYEYNNPPGSPVSLIYKMNSDGSGKTRLTNDDYPYYNNPYPEIEPSFSPDGSRIAFLSLRDRRDFQIYTMKSSDGGDVKQITSIIDSKSRRFPTYSPDGTSILFARNESDPTKYPNTDNGIYEIDSSTGALKFGAWTVSPYDAIYQQPSYSPDGSQIIYRMSYNGMHEIYKSIKVGGIVRLSQGGTYPSFSNDGNRIVYTSENGRSIYTANSSSYNNDVRQVPLDDFYSITRPKFQPIDRGLINARATGTGSNVTVSPVNNLQMAFQVVSVTGNTVANQLNPDELPPLPPNYSLLINSPMYDISTTAVYSGNITVTFNVPNIAVAPACSKLRSLHYENGAWTTNINAVPTYNSTTQICTVSQTVTSLSPFVVVSDNNPVVSNCSYFLNASSASVPAFASTGSTFAINTQVGCQWTASSSDSWITVTTDSGTGSGTVTYSVEANTGAERTGTIIVGGQSFNVTQNQACTYTITPASTNSTSGGGSGSFLVSTQNFCNWTASTGSNWITLNNSSGTLSGTVDYTISANDGNARVGTITVADQTFTVYQAAGNISNSAGKIVFVSQRDGNEEIYTMNADGSGQVRLTNNAAPDKYPSFSADGSKIVFASERDGNREIYVMNSDGSNKIRLTNNTFSDGYPSFSPDGSKIVFASDRDGGLDVFIMNSDGSNSNNPTKITTSTISQNYYPSFSPDGSKILFVCNKFVTSGINGPIYNSEICTKNSDNSGTETNLTNHPAFETLPRFSPDGSKVVFNTNRDSVNNDGNMEIYTMRSSDGGELTRLTNSLAYDFFPSFSPDGTKVLFESNRDGDVAELYTINSSDGSGITRLTNVPGGDYNASWTANQVVLPSKGKIAFSSTRTGDREIFTMNADGSNQINVSNYPSLWDDYPSWSPNGSKIVFTRCSNTSCINPDIYVMNADGSNQIRLTTDGRSRLGRWSPDGTKIVFDTSVSSNAAPDIFVMNTDGSNKIQLTTNTGYDYDARFSPDGSKIVFKSQRDGNWGIFVMDADGANQTRLTNDSNDDFGAFSPDGTKIVFNRYVANNYDVFVMNADGSNQVNLTNNPALDYYPTWSPDGAKILFYTNRDGNREIYTMNSDGTNPTRITNNIVDDYYPEWTSCSYSLNSNSVSLPATASNGNTFTVTGESGCAWTASTTDSWISITSGASGTGNGIVTYSVQTNTSQQPRVGTITAAGQTFTVTQAASAGSSCVSVTIPNNLTASNGSIISVPVLVGDLTNKGVYSFNLDLSFNPNVLRLAASGAFETTGTLSSNFTADVNTSIPGRLLLGADGINPLTGQGTLINLKFEVIGNAQSSSTLNWDSFTFNGGNPCAATSNGQLTVVNRTVSGVVTYGVGANPRPVPGVTLTAAGTPQISASSDATGAYQLSGLGAGSYTVTPSKAVDTNSINSFDASMIRRAGIQLITLTSNQRIAADANNDGNVNSYDTALVRRFGVGLTNPDSIVGQWKFNPVSRSYSSIASSLSNENYEAILVGEVSGEWQATAPPAAPEFDLFKIPAITKDLVDLATLDEIHRNESDQQQTESVQTGVLVTLPQNLRAQNGSVVTVPINVSDLTGQGIISYNVDLRFDPTVLQLTANPVQTTGTITGAGNGCVPVFNSPMAGQLLVGVDCIGVLSGSGTLLNLQFNVIGVNGSTSQLTFASFTFNGGNPAAKPTNGSFQVGTPTAASVMVSGRILSANGKGIRNVLVTLTEADGTTRSVLSGQSGYYRFPDVSAGQTVALAVSSKSRSFTQSTQIFSVTEDLSIDFVANE